MNWIKKEYPLSEVRTSSGGTRVRSIIEEFLPDLIILDIMMPDVGGIEVLYMLQGRQLTAGARIIAVTGLEKDDPRVQAAVDLGITEIIYKSADFIPDMISAIRRIYGSGEISASSTDDSDTAREKDSPVTGSVYTGESYEGFREEEKLEVETPAFDMKRVLNALGGDKEILRIVIDSFVEDSPELMEDLMVAFSASDQDLIHRHAHSLKGACSNIGAERVRILAFMMEKAAGSGDMKSAASFLPDLEKEYGILIEKLKNTTV